MADDWIKIRKCLFDHPKVARIARSASMSEPQVVGWLAKIWAWADSHTEDGVVRFLSQADAHRVTLAPEKFLAAMRQVGWLIESADGLSFPNYEAHMSANAKRRATETQRKKQVRATKKTAHFVRKVSAKKRTKCALEKRREEKRREDSIPPYIPPRGNDKDEQQQQSSFEDFWQAYPPIRKRSKKDAERAWRKALDGGADPDVILDAVRAFSGSPEGQSPYCPAPAPWLNQGRWEDDRDAWACDGAKRPVSRTINRFVITDGSDKL